jgi:hypothetical protein
MGNGREGFQTVLREANSKHVTEVALTLFLSDLEILSLIEKRCRLISVHCEEELVGMFDLAGNYCLRRAASNDILDADSANCGFLQVRESRYCVLL